MTALAHAAPVLLGLALLVAVLARLILTAPRVEPWKPDPPHTHCTACREDQP